MMTLAGRRGSSVVKPRIRCHVIHYFDRASGFEGASANTDADKRRAVVTTVLGSLNALPFDMDVKVCGLPGKTLVPLDLDLTGVADPRHLIYAGIEALVDSIDDYDYFLCVEDDVHIEAEAIQRMIRFRARARINEVLLPNRMELAGDGNSYCIDLLAVPGWRGLRRRFEGALLDVAVNPHSAMLFLSREQLKYAVKRVDLGRRENFFAGPLESAFANVHQPFLLWRTRVESAHQVVHLDRWRSSPLRAVVPIAAGSRTPVAGAVDDLTFDGLICVVRGWCMAGDGQPVPVTSIRLGEGEVEPIAYERHSRPDLRTVNERADLECGFTAAFALTDVPPELIGSRTFSVLGEGFRVDGPWPAGVAERAVAHPPVIPDEPPLPADDVARLTALLSESQCLLEYGTGGTSVLAARLDVPLVYSVESDASQLAALRHKLRGAGRTGRHVFVDAVIGPMGVGGVATGAAHRTAFGDYPLEVWNRIREEGRSPDLVLLNGPFRVACLLATLLNGAPGTRIVVSEYDDHPHYRVVEELVRVERSLGRAAEFVIPATVDREYAWALLARYVGDDR